MKTSHVLLSEICLWITVQNENESFQCFLGALSDKNMDEACSDLEGAHAGHH